jgi:hypothetical protein
VNRYLRAALPVILVVVAIVGEVVFLDWLEKLEADEECAISYDKSGCVTANRKGE